MHRVLLIVLGAIVVLALVGCGTPGGTAPAQVTPTTANYLPVVQRPENTPTPTSTPTIAPSPTATPTEAPGLPKFKNFNFEQGAVGWFQTPGNDIIIPTNQIVPYSGEWLAHLGGEKPSTDEIRQSITLPAGRAIYLLYHRQFDSADIIGGSSSDFFIAANGDTLVNETIASITDSGGQWETYTVDLSAYAGQTVLIRLYINAGDLTDIYLDDISLSSHP